jgi:hypothetical protein
LTFARIGLTGLAFTQPGLTRLGVTQLERSPGLAFTWLGVTRLERSPGLAFAWLGLTRLGVTQLERSPGLAFIRFSLTRIGLPASDSVVARDFRASAYRSAPTLGDLHGRPHCSGIGPGSSGPRPVRVHRIR